MTEPTWWPDVLDATRRRREYTAQLLAHATPTADGDRLLLEFPNAGLVADWRESRAGDALDGALEQLQRGMTVEVAEIHNHFTGTVHQNQRETHTANNGVWVKNSNRNH